MNRKGVIFILLNGFADWEGAYISTCLNCGVKNKKPANGFLNNVKHKSNELDYIKQASEKYTEKVNYVNEQAIRNVNRVTTNGTAHWVFARKYYML